MALSSHDEFGTYRSDIDGLRAVAVSSVIAFHAFPNIFKGGFIGVDIFFVISGFLIGSIIFGDLEHGGFSYRRFYTRRIKRIFPSLFLTCLAVFLVGWYVLLPDEFSRLGKHLAAGAGFVSNLTLWNEAGYFDASADTKPLLHLWSLGIEEQFYILWPLVLHSVWKRRYNFLGITLTIAVASWLYSAVTASADAVAGFYSPLSRFWELMIGGILAYLTMHKGEWLVKFGALRSAVGALLIGVSIFFLNNEFHFPGYWALLPTIGTFLVISAGRETWINRYLLGNSLTVGVGLISYPLYLWHWPILVFLKIIKGKILTPTDRLSVIAASVVLAFITYWLIERPIRQSSNIRWPQGLAVAMGTVAIVGLATFDAALVPRLKGDHISQILAAQYDWGYPPVAAENHSFGALRYFVESSELPSYTLFVGDSNMEQYAPRIDRAIKDYADDVNGAIMVGNQRGCSLLKEIISNEGLCPQGMAQLTSLIGQSSTQAVVIVGSWDNYDDALSEPENRRRFSNFLTSIAQTKRAYIILNIPSGDELSPANMFTGSRLDEITPKPISVIEFDFNRFENHFLKIDEILLDTARNSGAIIINPIWYLCPQKHCPVLDPTGMPLYLDSAHLTRSYAIAAATYIDLTLYSDTYRQQLGLK